MRIIFTPISPVNNYGETEVENSDGARSLIFDRYSGNVISDILNGDFDSFDPLPNVRQTVKIKDKEFCFNPAEDALYLAGLINILNPEVIPETLDKYKKIHYPEWFEFMESLSYSNIAPYKELIDHSLVNNDKDTLSAVTKYHVFSNTLATYDMLAFSCIQTPDCSVDGIDNNKGNMNDELRHLIYKLPSKDKAENENRYSKALSLIQSLPLNVTASFVYCFATFLDWFKYLIYIMIVSDDTLKICQNCGKYFYPSKRRDAKYCDNLSPQDETKTCKEYGKYITQFNKIRSDEALRLYKQIYNSKANRIKRCDNPKLQEDLTVFIDQANQWKNNLKNGTVKKEDYIAWLRVVKEKKV